MLLRIIASGLFALSLQSTAADMASDNHGRFVLSIEKRGPGSSELLAGNYVAAIEIAGAATRFPQPLGAYLNLCAGYIGTRQLDAADKACLDAVHIAGNPAANIGNPGSHIDREGLAMAHSNLGVLRALQGQLAEATEHFDKALRQRRHVDITRHNLALIHADAAQQHAP